MRRGGSEFFVQKGEEGKLGVFLRRRGISLSVVRSLKYIEGGILLNGCEAYTNQLLECGDVVSLQMQEEPGFSARPESIPLQLVYCSADSLVVNKPAGMAVHPGPSHHRGTLANAVCGMLAARGDAGVFRPVGRLDVGTSGLVLCAGNAASAALLGQSLEKVYVPVIQGRPAKMMGVIDAPLAPKTGSAVVQQVAARGRTSRTAYRVLSATASHALVAVRTFTGRTHQIRAHFAHIGHSLLGDAMYGGDTARIKRQALHCAALRFCEISGNRPGLCCPMPNDMLAIAHLTGLSLALPEDTLWKALREMNNLNLCEKD